MESPTGAGSGKDHAGARFEDGQPPTVRGFRGGPIRPCTLRSGRGDFHVDHRLHGSVAAVGHPDVENGVGAVGPGVIECLVNGWSDEPASGFRRGTGNGEREVE